MDIVIRRGESADPSLTQRRFMPEAISPVCTPAMLRHAHVRSLSDLAAMTWLTADMRPTDWPDWLRFAKAGPMSAKRQLSFDHSYLALEVARDGLGVAMGSLYLIQEDLAAGDTLVPIFPALVMPSQPYVMAYGADRVHEVQVASFEDWLTTAGRDHERATRRALRELIKT